VPQGYATDLQLGRWVQRQKGQYKKPGHGNLAGDRLDKLRELGAIADWAKVKKGPRPRAGGQTARTEVSGHRGEDGEADEDGEEV